MAGSLSATIRKVSVGDRFAVPLKMMPELGEIAAARENLWVDGAEKRRIERGQDRCDRILEQGAVGARIDERRAGLGEIAER